MPPPSRANPRRAAPNPCSDYQDTVQGACYGIAHTPTTARLRHDGTLATLTQLPGLLLTGQDVLGDGVILAAVSGLLAAAHVAPLAVVGAVGKELAFGRARRAAQAGAAAAAAADDSGGDDGNGGGGGGGGGGGSGARAAAAQSEVAAASRAGGGT